MMQTPQPPRGSAKSPAPLNDPILRREVERVQVSGVLGEARSRALFDYLAEKTLLGPAPKEIAIAMDVFGKRSDFDVSQDALVRVYIHKLRKALESFYASVPPPAGATLYIPRGEYRLKINPQDSVAPRPVSQANDRRSRLLMAASLCAAVLMGIGIAWLWKPTSELDRVRASPIWSSIIKDDRPIMIVMGDYYLIGETDASADVKRLIREYAINSKSDLNRYVVEHPELAERYMDVGLRYLPISSAVALRNVMAVLAPQNRRISVSNMSDLEPGTIKSTDIVYIGYLSGMGMFQDFAFTGSRFEVGESYDEVIDRKTHHLYTSEVGRRITQPAPPTGKEQMYHDYGIFEKFRSPGGNTILVISGTRDEGVSQTAEAITNEQKLNEFVRQVDAGLPMEALWEVSAFDGTNLSGKLLLESNRDRATQQR